MRSFIAFLFLAVSAFSAGKTTTDVEYANIAGTSLKLDASVPEGDGPFPACILVHGGGWTGGDKQRQVKPLFEPLTTAGFAWFSINYRLAPADKFPACADDVETAIRWVKAHAQDYRIDPKRIALIGESAGGHLVSLVGARAATGGETRVAAVVPFYAPHDLLFQQARPAQLAAVFGLKEMNAAAEKFLRDASATSYVRSDLPPFLLLHGNQDALVPLEQSVRFQKMLRAAGATCDLIVVEGGPHGMARWAALKSDYATQLVAWLKQKL